MEGEQRVLSYGDVLLRRRDVEILEGDHFLNDHIIEFFFEYLSNQRGGDGDILLVNPSIAFLIANCPNKDELSFSLSALEFHRRQMVLLPVNDNADFEIAGGGSHWSLLVYHRAANTFVHFDSAGGANYVCACRLAKRAGRLLGGAATEATFEPALNSPRQSNSFDCGVFVMAIAKVITELGGGGDIRDLAATVERRVTRQLVDGMRRSTWELIQSLAAAKPISS